MQELEGEIEVSPALQLSWIQIAALEIPIFRLRRGEYVGLIFRLEDEELLAIVLQDVHHPLFALCGSSGMSITVFLADSCVRVYHESGMEDQGKLVNFVHVDEVH